MQYPATMQPTRARVEQVVPEDEDTSNVSTVFTPVPPKLARNFYVADMYLENSTAGILPAAYDKSDAPDFLSSFNGLEAVSDDIKDLLPPECRKAFDGALEKEGAWRSKWGPESEKMSRRQPVIDKAIVPYSMS